MAGRGRAGEEREGGGKPAFPRACEEGGHLYAALHFLRVLYMLVFISSLTRLVIVIDVIATCRRQSILK